MTFDTVGNCCVDKEAAAVEANTAAAGEPDTAERGLLAAAAAAAAGCNCRIWCRLTETGVLDEEGVPEGVAPTLLLI